MMVERGIFMEKEKFVETCKYLYYVKGGEFVERANKAYERRYYGGAFYY